MARASQQDQTEESSELGALRYRRIVVKAGTGALTGPSGLDSGVMANLVRQICQVREASGEVLLVTSGAIAAGRSALGQDREEIGHDISSRQVFAAVGQSRLMHTYQEMFATHGAQVAQTLLDIKDLEKQIVVEVREAVRQIKTEAKRVQAASIARKLAQRKLDAEEKKFEVGLSTSFNVLEFQEDLLLDESIELRAIIDHRKSRIRLRQVMATTMARHNIHVSKDSDKDS